ncbi:hypothetical protein [Occallatibacter savannae]|uniref:hypothetical protein n=1 Tax=Occallatibacter savannae TaxID=1002691 RepID=UPI000D68F1F8|nr:hypothetical protein [Occallatibacter savannae]
MTTSTILRIKVKGGWSVPEFVSVLDRLQKSYSPMDGLSTAFEPFTAAELVRVSPSTGRGLQSSIREAVCKVSGADENKLLLLSGLSTPLMIQRIQMASPGVWEILGNLNPLKVIADFITSWRAENTKRQELSRTAVLRREEMMAGLLHDVIELVPLEARALHAERIISTSTAICDTIISNLEIVARTSKIESLQLLLENDRQAE